MRRAGAFALGFGLVGSAALAEQVIFDPAPVIDCLDQGAQHACIGAGRDPCARQNLPSTVVMEGCLKAEFEFWQGLAERAYAGLEAEGLGIDARTEFADPQPPRRVAALERAHQAWLDYREAHCAYQLARWHGGSGAGGAFYRCKMELTGAYALQLQPDIWMDHDYQDEDARR